MTRDREPGTNSGPVTLQRSNIGPTPDQPLWKVIRTTADALSFDRYPSYVEPMVRAAAIGLGLLALVVLLRGRRSRTYAPVGPDELAV